MSVPAQSISPEGPKLSRLICGVMRWGLWGHQLNTDQMLSRIETCLELGITTFDHADIYGGYTTEEAFGQALKKKPALREHMQLITKCGIKMPAEARPDYHIKSYDTSSAHIIASAEQSLKNLCTDHLDLLLIHRPSPLMDPKAIAEAFTQLKKSGKVLHFGVSNFIPSQFEMLNDHFPLVNNQVEASILHLEPFIDGTFDQSIRYQSLPMVWSPLGGGQFFDDQPGKQIQRILRIAEKQIERREGRFRIDQWLLAWLLHHPAKLMPVLGTGDPDRLRAAAGAFDITLNDEEWFELWQASTGKEVP